MLRIIRGAVLAAAVCFVVLMGVGYATNPDAPVEMLGIIGGVWAIAHVFIGLTKFFGGGRD